ncbi:MAG: DEAD/DEAH box helicase [Treponema sp.]|jgi:SNF2 family DNA or RNA helicase/uncharacterized Zn finger protein|nr:DEAD/DEAH box helicase [Treponema sp.]
MTRNQYGQTPWGRWFIDALDAPSGRLDRGRSYANTDKVTKLEIKDRLVKARVRGNYRPFYKVEILFPELAEKERVLGIIEKDPSLLARIAAGEMPEELLLKLKDEGIRLISSRWSDMQRQCDCPDNGDPCKHEAAVYYTLAKYIDADPRLLFTLRGLDLSALMEKFGAEPDAKIAPPFTVETDNGERRILSDQPVIPELPSCISLILSLLPQTPFGHKDLGVSLAEFYHYTAHFEMWDDADREKEEFTASHSYWKILCTAPAPAPGKELFLEQKAIDGQVTRLSVYESFLQFRSFSSADGTASYRFLFYLFKFLNILTAAGAFVPCVLLERFLYVVWKPFEGLEIVKTTLEKIAEFEPAMLKIESKKGGKRKYVTGLSVTRLLSCALLGEWVKRRYFFSQKMDEIQGLFFLGLALDVSRPAKRSLPLSIDHWLSALSVDWKAWKYRLTLWEESEKRVAPSKHNEVNSKEYNFKLSMDALLTDDQGKIQSIPLKDAAKRTGRIDVLKAPSALAHYLPELASLSSFASVSLSEERLVDFLDNAANLLSRLGVEVVFPKSLKRELKPRLVLSTNKKKQGGGLLSSMSLDEILEWKWQVAIGNSLLTEAEFAALVKQKRSLVKFHDQFVRVDAGELARLFKSAEKPAPSTRDFLKEYFSGNSVLSFDAEQIIENLFRKQDFPRPESLNAVLRPYQMQGYQWACSLLLMGFGAILADDMGLGKTIQAISVILRLKENGLLNEKTEKTLVIAPSALLENWARELAKFAPCLTIARYHGVKRRFDDSDVFLTTYQTVTRDAEKLFERKFALLIVDEAHLLKNADTRSAKTVKNLRSRFKLALSGTPIENRLEDMRSLFDFILPGYLGSAGEFKEKYRFPIEVKREKAKADELRLITAPFLMRRLKTDKAIIADLPDKVVKNEYAVLEKEQAALYESVVEETLKKSEEMRRNDGEAAPQRHVLILGLLTALKQICNHPRVFDKESPCVSKLSGKAQLLLELLDEIRRSHEKTLVFSQYVETLVCLSTIIRNELGENVLIYHGGLSQTGRTGVVDRFQSDDGCKILLASLRAGGLGLNLTSTSQVIHYDLWYNPAVENQATDRAFRIGQRRNVFVHRFITKNTFEEKIDALLSGKRELADMTVGAGEAWLSRMSHEELRALFNRVVQ